MTEGFSPRITAHQLNIKRLATLIGQAYIMLMLFVSMRPLQSAMFINGIDIQFYLLIALFAVLMPLVLIRMGKFLMVALKDKLLLFLIFLALISTVWSTDIAETLKANFVFIGGTFLGIYIALQFRLREQMWILVKMLAISAALSLIVVMAFPKLGSETTGIYSGAWNGIFNHKNELGRNMAINVILSFLLLRDADSKWKLWLNILMSVWLMVMANSATAFIVLVVASPLVFIFRIFSWTGTRINRIVPLFLSIAFMGLGLFALLVAFVPSDELVESSLTAIGRADAQDTIYSRQLLWDALSYKLKKHPWLGYGFGDAWVDTYGRTSIGQNNWAPNQAHNGYLEVALQLGIVGLLALMLHFAVHFCRTILLARTGRSKEYIWALIFPTLLLISSITESVLFGKLTLLWTLYVSLALSTKIEVDRAKTDSGTSDLESIHLLAKVA